MTIKYHNTFKIPVHLVTYFEYGEINDQTADELQQADDFMAQFDGPVIFDWNNARNEENTSGIDIDPDYDEYINEPYFSSTNDIDNSGNDVIDCAIYINENKTTTKGNQR